MKYNFYFDESFNTRLISKESLKSNNYFNSYVSTGIGIIKSDTHKTFCCYKKFEKIYKEKYKTAELKATIINKEHYRYGIKKFNKVEIDMYSDFFDFLLKNNVVYYISICDKLEYLLTQCKFSDSRDYKYFIYCLTKLINVYRPSKVINDLTNNNTNLFLDLYEFLLNLRNDNKNFKLKTRENETIDFILKNLNYINPSLINYYFSYDFTYIGFRELVNELSSEDVSVIIDKEGTGRIKESAKKQGFLKVRQMNSLNSPGVRISDMFCGFISRMLRAIYDDLKHDTTVPYSTPHYLNDEWFNINEKQFLLYKSVAKYLKKYSTIYNTFYIEIYFDLFYVFVLLVNYFDQFKNFNDYNNILYTNHYRNCNTYILQNFEIKLNETFSYYIY